jgi:hypothetical protein
MSAGLRLSAANGKPWSRCELHHDGNTPEPLSTHARILFEAQQGTQDEYRPQACVERVKSVGTK